MADFPMASDGSLKLSDVLEVLAEADQNFADQVQQQHQQVLNNVNLNDMRPQVQVNQSSMIVQPQQQQQQQQLQRNRVYIEIVEQPASKALRFRYECEGRSAGSIPGVNSTPENKTFPTIRIVGYKGPAIVVVSCVTKDPPYRPHPHNLVGKEVCKKGVCRIKLSGDNMTVSFDKLGIQCVKRKDIEEALNVRETEQVDPFGTGFDHKRQPTSTDLNAVRLAFQVFLEGPNKGQFKTRLNSVVSEPIYDKKANSDLVICKLSHCTAPAMSGIEMVLLCEKVCKEDIQVRFFEEINGQVVWESFGEFQPSAVHKQVAISFRTPSYRVPDIDRDVNARIQLRRPSDGATSDALDFKFSSERSRKRPRQNPRDRILEELQNEAMQSQGNPPNKVPHLNFGIKEEPTDRLSPFGGPVASPPMFFVPDNTGAQNMGGLRPIPSPGRTQSPMDNAIFNIPPELMMVNPLQPVPVPQGCPSPMLAQNVFENEASNQLDRSYVLNNPNILTDAINNAIGIDNVFDNTQPNQEMNFSLSQLDNVDFNNLSISDIVKGPINGEDAANAMEESNVTDSFTRLTRNTMQDLCQLNDMYKPMRE